MTPQLALWAEPEPAPISMHVVAPDGALVAIIPVEGDDWHAAECWAYLANVADRKRRPEVYARAGARMAP